MRLVDLSARRKSEEQMASVLENEYIRIEAKDGRKITSINVSVGVTDCDHNVAVIAGNIESSGFRTAECLLNFATAIVTQVKDPDAAKMAMRATYELAMKMFDDAVVEFDGEDGCYEASVKVGEE